MNDLGLYLVFRRKQCGLNGAKSHTVDTGFIKVKRALSLERVVPQYVARNLFQIGAQYDVDQTIDSMRNVSAVSFNQFGNKESTTLVSD